MSHPLDPPKPRVRTSRLYDGESGTQSVIIIRIMEQPKKMMKDQARNARCTAAPAEEVHVQG